MFDELPQITFINQNFQNPNFPAERKRVLSKQPAMGSKDTKTGESEPEETVFFFDGLAKAPSLIKRAAEETETLGGEKKSVDVVELAKEGLETIIEAIHVRSSHNEQKLNTKDAGKELVESVEHEKASEETGTTSHKDKANDHVDEANEETEAVPKEPLLTKEEQADFWKFIGEFSAKCCSPKDDKKD